jgi:hypothetical protein
MNWRLVVIFLQLLLQSQSKTLAAAFRPKVELKQFVPRGARMGYRRQVKS